MKKQLFIFSFAGALLTIVSMNIIDYSLQNGDSAYGIVSFELAGSIERSVEIINYWIEGSNLQLASFSLGFDYLFMLFYGIFLSLWTLVISDKFPSNKVKNLSKIVVMMFIIAVILDGIENYALLKIVSGFHDQAYSSTAFWAASIKFGLIGLAIVYNAVLSILSLIKRV